MDGATLAAQEGRSDHGSVAENLGAYPGNQIYISKEALPPALRNRLIRLAAFQNPEFYKAQAMRLSTYDTPRRIACLRITPSTLDCRVAAWMTWFTPCRICI